MDKVVKAVKADPTPVKVEGAVEKAAPRFLNGAPATDTYDLLAPMEFDGTEYRSITFSRLKGKHFHKMRLLVQMGANPDIALLHLVTGIPIEVLDEMDADDFAEVTERAESFIPARFRQEDGQDSPTGPSMQA